MTITPGKSGSRRRETDHDPLDPENLTVCAENALDLSHVLSPAASASAPTLGNGLRGSLHTAPHDLARTPHTPTRLLGVHNPTETPASFTVADCFPDVSTGTAHLVFIAGSVETSGRGRTDLRLLLRPGAHVWLAQTEAPLPSRTPSGPEGAAER